MRTAAASVLHKNNVLLYNVGKSGARKNLSREQGHIQKMSGALPNTAQF